MEKPKDNSVNHQQNLIAKVHLALHSSGIKGLMGKIYHFSIYRIIKKINNTKLNRYLKSEIFVRHKYKRMDLFADVHIETVNRCNGVCPFCPANKNQKQRPYKKMSEALFYKIIDELRELDYGGKIALFGNNEPFLDNRITEFCTYTRNCLPKAFIYISTNATLLSFQKFLEILPYVDCMVINNYNDNYLKHPNVAKIYDYSREHVELQPKVTIQMRLLNQVLTSRGGMAPNKGRQKAPRTKCPYPFTQMLVRPDGKISLCCNDVLGVYTMGDASKQTLKEIWENDYYREIRKEMRMNGRKNLRLCQDCDNVVRRVTNRSYGELFRMLMSKKADKLKDRSDRILETDETY
jgi:radical SAM protein with 4Fe4S-binding SPASM domain